MPDPIEIDGEVALTKQKVELVPGPLESQLRRSLRVGRNAGRVLEEFGVKADALHELTRNDVLNCDVDLIGKAVSMLKTGPPVDSHRKR